MGLKKQIEEEEAPGGAYDESNDAQFEQMPHLRDGGILMPPVDTGGSNFAVDGGDSDTVKGLPLNPDALPQPPAPQPMALPQGAPQQPAAAAPAPMPARPMPGMPPGVTPDALKSYLDSQRASINKFNPDRTYAVEKDLQNQQGGLQNFLARKMPALGDAIMQGVSRAGNPGWSKQQQERETEDYQNRVGAEERGRKGTMEQVEANEKIDSQDPGSAKSQAYQKAFGPIFAKMGYDAKAIGGMPASQIGTLADLGVRYGDAQMQQEYKNAMLAVQKLTAQATMMNQTEQRRQEDEKSRMNAAEGLQKRPWYQKVAEAPMVPLPKSIATKEMERQLQGGESTGTVKTPSFATPEQAASAGLPDGARVTIGGKTGTWRHK